MKGASVPLIAIPRYSTFVGNQEFMTVPMDMSEYATGYITVWRGKIVDSTAATVEFALEDSADAENWTLMVSAPLAFDPGEDQTARKPLVFLRKWFRIRATFATATTPAMSCWAVGELNMRVS